MHVVFCIAPFTGHVNPSLALVSELARRGHRVSFATTEPFGQAVRDAGGRPVIYQAAQYPAAEPARPGAAAIPGDQGGLADLDLARSVGGQLRELRAVLPVLISAFGDDAADVVVCDPMCWAGRALAGRWQVPPVNSVTTMIGSARWSLGPISATVDPASTRLPRLLAATTAVLTGYQTGLTAGHLLGAGPDIPAIAYHPRAFEAHGDEFGPDVHFAGPCLAQRRTAGHGTGGGRARRPADGRPVVLVSLGTVFNRQPDLFRRCIDALADLSCHVVAALGGMGASALGPLPSNAQAHAYVPLPEVLCYADVFVGHGGLTSIMEALSFGVPIVALPQIPEQRLNADRLAELGLGRCLPPASQRLEQVRQAVAALLRDTAIHARLGWMRAEIERAPGAPLAADAIESAADRHAGRQTCTIRAGSATDLRRDS